jgi:hypothetical protein
MHSPKFLGAIGWLLAALGAVALTLILILALQDWRESRRHLRRLGRGIIEIAESIQLDLAGLHHHAAAAVLSMRCAECRVRAEQVARELPLARDALRQALGDLHEEHLRIVQLRSELDLLIASVRRGGGANGVFCSHTSTSVGSFRQAACWVSSTSTLATKHANSRLG